MDSIKAKTKNAKIRKLGQTASNYAGNDNTAKRIGYSGPRDLSAK
jgi:hypothetical protein